MNTNWAGNIIYSTNNVHSPSTVEEVQELIKNHSSIRVVGTRHSFNTIADSDNAQLSTRYLNRIISLDKENNTVTVEGGIQYGELCSFLASEGYALHNLASLPHISITGACVTATHGSGVNNGCLSTAVTALELVNANGDIISLSKTKDEKYFHAAVVNLGAVGVVTKITLQVQASFKMKQSVFVNMPMAALENNFKEIMSAGYSVSLFTDWRNKNINQVWIKEKCIDSTSLAITDFYGAKPAITDLHPLDGLSAENCTSQMNVEGEWYERLPHFKMGFTPSSGTELQTEYFIPFDKAYQGLLAIEKLHEKIAPHLYVSEIRAIAADELWMSPFYQRSSIAFHFTWKQEWEQVQNLLPLIEEALSPYDPIPHWGKLFVMSTALLKQRVKRLSDFKDFVLENDPQQKFSNDYIKYIFS